MGSMVQEIGTSLGGLCKHVEKLNTSVNEQLTEMKTGLTAVEKRFEEMENRFEGMENKFEKKFEEMEKRFEKVENQFLKIENPRFRDGQHEEVHDEKESARSAQATPVDPSSDTKDVKNPNEYAYVVAGGYGKEGKPLNSAEIFDKTTNSWIELKPMNKSRADASSVVYNGQVLVTGGSSDGKNIVSSIEQFSRNVNPLVPPCWSNFSVNLPKALRGHRSVLYDDRMLVVGGFDEENISSDIIYEIQPHFPFNTKVLAKLPSPRPMEGCGVVVRNDKILIFGGGESWDKATAKVTMYDITKNQFKELAPLPYVVCNMATVKYGENVILVGGSNKPFFGDEKNTVISYNIETEESTKLPPMKHSRFQCCAVVDGNSLVLMGGRGQNEALKSVKAFDFKTSKWSDLPSMKEARRGFTAEIV
jgi:N-acetylneuraminic acid mutarotase